MRFLTLAALFVSIVCGEDITLPLGDGNILISAQFIHVTEFGSYSPELNLKIKNQTSSPWPMLKLQFQIGGLCNGKPRQWSIPVWTSLGWAEDHPVVKEYKDSVISLMGKVDSCTGEIINATIVLAENSKTHIDGAVEAVDLEKPLLEIQTKRDADAAARAEEARKAAEAKAKADANREAEEAAKAAEEQRKLRASCRIVYENTIDKKVKDLTVREEQQVRACQVLGLYPPE